MVSEKTAQIRKLQFDQAFEGWKQDKRCFYSEVDSFPLSTESKADDGECVLSFTNTGISEICVWLL